MSTSAVRSPPFTDGGPIEAPGRPAGLATPRRSPPFTDGGPIEASVTLPVVRLSTPLRRSRTAAPLKRRPDCVHGTRRFVPLRRSRTAAPLKLDFAIRDAPGRGASPPFTDGGPIEACAGHFARWVTFSSPPFTDGGPIEARSRSAWRRRCVEISPPFTDGGPIEASLFCLRPSSRLGLSAVHGRRPH